MKKIKLLLSLTLLSLTGSVFAGYWTFCVNGDSVAQTSNSSNQINNDWGFLPTPTPKALLQGDTVHLIYDDLIYSIGDRYNNVLIDDIDENFDREYDSDNYASETGFFSSSYPTKIVINQSFKNYKPTKMDAWFGNLYSLEEIEGLSNIDTSEVLSMNGLFNHCISLTSIDLSSFDTSNLESMSDLFFTCVSLSTINLNGWDVSSVTNMRGAFYYIGASELNISNWDVSKVRNMDYLFSSNTTITSLDLSQWQTSSLTSMKSMFDSCSSLQSVNLSNFNTSNVTDMYSLFRGCSLIKVLDLSSFNTSNLLKTESMFSRCSQLETIYVSTPNWNMSSVTDSDGMFFQCYNLRGGNGTTFSSSYVNKARAIVDGTNNQRGYLSLLPNE